MPVAVEDLEAVVIGAVALTARALQAVGADLTLVQWRSLVVLAGEADAVSVGDLATRLGATSSATSRLVGRLSARGLLQRRRDPSNRRSSLVTLTPAGDALVRRVVVARAASLRRLRIDRRSAAALPGLAAAFRELG